MHSYHSFPPDSLLVPDITYAEVFPDFSTSLAGNLASASVPDSFPISLSLFCLLCESSTDSSEVSFEGTTSTSLASAIGSSVPSSRGLGNSLICAP